MDHREAFIQYQERAKDLGPVPSMHIELAWLAASREAHLFEHWASWLDQSYAGIVSGLCVRPKPFTEAGVQKVRDVVCTTFEALLEALPQPPIQTFKALGSPPVLAFWAGLTEAPLSVDDRDLSIYRSSMGIPQKGASDTRHRAVIEPATGMVWPSATALARDLECARISAYKHLSKNGDIQTLKGRVFEYLDSNKE